MHVVKLKEADLTLLQAQPLFADLPTELFREIEKATQVMLLKKGEFLFQKGDLPNHIYVLSNGAVKLNLISESGDEKIIKIIDRPMSFAEAMVLGNIPFCPLNAQAVSDSNILAINAKVYQQQLRKSADACFQIMSQMSMRLHWMINEIDQLTLHNASYRLVHYLLHQVELQKTQDLVLAKALIASRISVKPETLSRILKQLQEEELIKSTNKKIHILNLEGLYDYLNSKVA